MRYRVRKSPHLADTWYVWLTLDDKIIAGPKGFRSWYDAMMWVFH